MAEQAAQQKQVLMHLKEYDYAQQGYEAQGLSYTQCSLFRAFARQRKFHADFRPIPISPNTTP